jgi:hypothetical protein
MPLLAETAGARGQTFVARPRCLAPLLVETAGAPKLAHRDVCTLVARLPFGLLLIIPTSIRSAVRVKFSLPPNFDAQVSCIPLFHSADILQFGELQTPVRG